MSFTGGADDSCGYLSMVIRAQEPDRIGANLAQISHESRTNLVRIVCESCANLARIPYESGANLMRIWAE